MRRGLEVDAFVIYTDNETWAGAVHPSAVSRHYREATGIAARLVAVGLTSTGFTAAPALIGDFVADRL